MSKALTLLDHRGKPFPRERRVASRVPLLRSKFDAAQTNNENSRHWAQADALSALSALTPEIRSKLRNRSRYEIANNSYASGIIETLTNDVIGTGPSLQLRTENTAFNRTVEKAFYEWACEVQLADKLRTMKRAKAGDGAGIALLVNNPGLRTPVQLDLRLVEDEQVASPWGSWFDNDHADGIKFDRHGNPIRYTVLREHPGSAFFGMGLSESDDYPASQVIHWFRRLRPGQARGVPEITPALPLFAQLRRYTLAVIAAAETAADFAAVLETDAAAGDDAPLPDPFEELEIVRRMMMTLPAGSKLHQFKAEQPTNTYEMFKREILCEIARCLNMPYNVAAGNSSGYNYASGRLDHQVYFKSIRVERDECEYVVADPIFKAWLDEAILIPRYLPRFATPYSEWPWQWFWPGWEHVDPLKEATAQETRLRNHTTTLAAEYAAKGLDWEREIRQRAKEKELLDALGLSVEAVAPAPGTPRVKPVQQQPEDEDEEEETEDEEEEEYADAV